jgi:hypothetical protein
MVKNMGISRSSASMAGLIFALSVVLGAFVHFVCERRKLNISTEKVTWEIDYIVHYNLSLVDVLRDHIPCTSRLLEF